MDAVLRWLDRLQGRWGPVQFVVAVGRKFGDDQARNLAALLAYYAFLATFPLLLVLVTVLGIVLHDYPAAQQRVLHSALVDFPIIGDQLKGNIHSLNRTGTGLIVGLIGTSFGARGLTLAVQNAFNTVWSVPYTRRPPFFGRQLRSLALLAVIGIALIVTGTLSGVASVLGHRGLAVSFGVLAASAVVNAGLFLLGFRLATAREVPTRRFAPAAVISAVGWQVLLTIGGYLVAHELRHAEQVYGLFGLVLGLLAWLHVQAQLTLFVLEADAVRTQRLWPRALDPQALESGDRRAYTSYAQAQRRRQDSEITVTFAAPRQEVQDIGVETAPVPPGGASSAASRAVQSVRPPRTATAPATPTSATSGAAAPSRAPRKP
ncbi:MAG TPA: YihY/virulence factor BrkB family protein [Actinocrinis sp.]|nr:YihY/virulence factor BrkB family protein [Actinocrinis sp.]